MDRLTCPVHPHSRPHRRISFHPNRMLFSQARPAITPCHGGDLWGCLLLMPKVIQTAALKCKFLCHCISSATLSLPLTLCGVKKRGPMELRTPRLPSSGGLEYLNGLLISQQRSCSVDTTRCLQPVNTNIPRTLRKGPAHVGCIPPPETRTCYKKSSNN